MKLCFTGRGAAFCPQEGNTSAYLREGGRLLLIDCGETVFGRLLQTHALSGVHEVTLLLTHLHPDHAGSFGSLGMYCRFALGFPLTVALPEDEAYEAQVRTLAQLTGAGQCCRYVRAGEVGGFEGLTGITYIPTRHAPGLLCYSLCFETPLGGVFYSGDTLLLEPLEAFLRAHPCPEAIYHEASLEKSPASIHLPLEKLQSAVPPSLRARTFLMHLSSPQMIEAGKEAGFETVTLVAQT